MGKLERDGTKVFLSLKENQAALEKLKDRDWKALLVFTSSLVRSRRYRGAPLSSFEEPVSVINEAFMRACSGQRQTMYEGESALPYLMDIIKSLVNHLVTGSDNRLTITANSVASDDDSYREVPRSLKVSGARSALVPDDSYREVPACKESDPEQQTLYLEERARLLDRKRSGKPSGRHESVLMQ